MATFAVQNGEDEGANENWMSEGSVRIAALEMQIRSMLCVGQYQNL